LHFPLSSREKRLLGRLARGMKDDLIAGQIGGTRAQIAAQRQRLLDKLGIGSRAEIADAAKRLAKLGGNSNRDTTDLSQKERPA